MFVTTTKSTLLAVILCLGRQREVMAGAGRMEEEEDSGKVGRVAQNNVAICSDFRAQARFDWINMSLLLLCPFPFY